MNVIRAYAVLLVLLPVGLSAETAEAGGRTSALRGGVLATFSVAGEEFRVWTKDPETIAALYALDAGTSTASIPNGRLRPGPGRGAHNAPWSWHLDPRDIEMVDVTIELCDATPSYVEANRREFLRTVKRYCAWGAELIALEDFR